MYDALGITGNTNLLVAGIYNVVGPIASEWHVTGVSCNLLTKNLKDFIFIVFILDRVGRRKPLIIGTIGITIALICEAAINSQNTDGSNRGLSIAGVFFLFCVSIIFSCSYGPISWVYMSEVMPMQIRARGSAFATGFGNWLVATFWAQISPLGLASITWRFYFIFAG
jgi:MFS family permease